MYTYIYIYIYILESSCALRAHLILSSSIAPSARIASTPHTHKHTHTSNYERTRTYTRCVQFSSSLINIAELKQYPTSPLGCLVQNRYLEYFWSFQLSQLSTLGCSGFLKRPNRYNKILFATSSGYLSWMWIVAVLPELLGGLFWHCFGIPFGLLLEPFWRSFGVFDYERVFRCISFLFVDYLKSL